MSYTVLQLINNAFYASGIVSRDFETVSGAQSGVGLQCLNELLADKVVDNGAIPYYSKYEFYGVDGQEQYYVPNLIELATLVFFISDVRYQMCPVSRDMYFGSSRANNISSLPFNYHLERQFGGASIFMYFKPNEEYLFQAWGKFRLGSVTINQDLTSNVARVNLGAVSIGGTGLLSANELVINGEDLAGTYANAAALVTAINSALDDVSAALYNNEITLSNTTGGNINITTLGTQSSANYVTFYNFSTQDGPLDQTFMPLVLDQFYINYLRYQLARRLCFEYSFDVPPGVLQQLNEYDALIEKKSTPLDLHISSVSMLTQGGQINYGQVNFGGGWIIPSV